MPQSVKLCVFQPACQLETLHTEFGGNHQASRSPCLWAGIMTKHEAFARGGVTCEEEPL